MARKREVFISVDVEASGPIPGQYSLLQIGACEVDNAANAFACFLKPINANAVPAALEVTGLSLARLEREGTDPKLAMQEFAKWIAQVADSNSRPVFVGLNAAFDWSFINYYFHFFSGGNPFGISALDIKSLYMGLTGCSWQDTSARQMSKMLHPRTQGDHDALHDAQFQAELFRLLRAKRHGVETETIKDGF
jgi:DNA polymerase III epsilon subunit-like protein